MKIGVVVSSSQGTLELVGVGKPQLRGKRRLVWKVEPEVRLEARTHMEWFLSGKGGGIISKGTGN